MISLNNDTKFISVRLASDQTNFTLQDHVEFDTVIFERGGFSLSTGSGQDNGQITVPVSGYYELYNQILLSNVPTGNAVLIVRWSVGTTNIGANFTRVLPPSSTNADSSINAGTGTEYLEAGTQVRLRIGAAFNLTGSSEMSGGEATAATIKLLAEGA